MAPDPKSRYFWPPLIAPATQCLVFIFQLSGPQQTLVQSYTTSSASCLFIKSKKLHYTKGLFARVLLMLTPKTVVILFFRGSTVSIPSKNTPLLIPSLPGIQAQRIHTPWPPPAVLPLRRWRRCRATPRHQTSSSARSASCSETRKLTMTTPRHARSLPCWRHRSYCFRG